MPKLARNRNIFSKKKRKRSPLIFILLGLFALAFFLIPESPPPQISAPIGLTLEATSPPTSTPPPPPTHTPLPFPTGVHGGRIIFTCTRGEYNQICMVNRDGSGLLQITHDKVNHYYPSLSPKGEVIIYASNESFGTFDLYLLVLSTSQQIELTHEIGNVFSPAYSPDGEKILFINKPEGEPTGLWIMDSNGENARLVYGGRNQAGVNPLVSAAWSPDGKTIALAMTVDQAYEYEIFLLDLDDADAPPRRVTYGLLGIAGSVAWSPSGRELLVSAGPPLDKDIFRYEIESGIITRLTYGGNNNAAVYSPDGEWIAFNSLRNNDQADIYLIRTDGTDLRQLTDNPEPDWQPQWEP
jgi:TolB protein